MDSEQLQPNMDNCGVPQHCQDELLLYITHGVPTGGFLNALLSNDLKGTFIRADQTNQRAVNNYVMFLYNYAPVACWGSPERVAAWISRKGLKGTEE